MAKWDNSEDEIVISRNCAAHGCPLGNPIDINGFKTCRFHANKNPDQWQSITKNIRRNIDAIQYLTAIHKIPLAVIVRDESVRGVHGCKREQGELLTDYESRLSEYVSLKVYENIASASHVKNSGLSQFDEMLQSVKRSTMINQSPQREYKKAQYGDDQ